MNGREDRIEHFRVIVVVSFFITSSFLMSLVPYFLSASCEVGVMCHLGLLWVEFCHYDSSALHNQVIGKAD